MSTARFTIIAFPFAGGNEFCYRPLAAALHADGLALKTLEYPGRGTRHKAPLLDDIHALAEDCFVQVRAIMTAASLLRPYAFFGHSMGALVAYLVTLRMRLEGLPAPVHLFLTGRCGPTAPMRDAPWHNTSAEIFMEKLRELGGSPAAILSEPDVMAYFEPIIRADIKAVECYVHNTVEPPLSIPMTAIVGDAESTTLEDALLWQRECLHPLNAFTLEGGHFFIQERAADVSASMRRTLSQYLSR